MNPVLTKLLLIAVAVSAVGYFIFDQMWDSTKDKNTETHQVINETDVPRS